MGRTIIYFNAKLCQPDHQTKGPESDHSGQKPYPIIVPWLTAISENGGLQEYFDTKGMFQTKIISPQSREEYVGLHGGWSLPGTSTGRRGC